MVAYISAGVIGLVVIYFLTCTRYPIKATLTHKGVTYSKNLPEAIRSRIHKFSRETLGPEDVLNLKGITKPNGQIRWIFPKSVAPEIAQRIRNFMVNEVYL